MEEQQIVDKPKIYQALGIVSGILELTEERYSSLLVGEERYCATVSPKVQAKHQPGQLQNFKIYPAIREGELGFSLRRVTKKIPREGGILLRGCWEMHEEEPRLVIHRNLRTRRTNPTAFPVIWKEAPVADGQYWEIEAKLCGESLHVISASGPFEPPQKYRKKYKKTYAKAKSDVPRPILKGEKIAIKSDAPPPILRSDRKAIDSPESEVIAETASEEIAFKANRGIEENPMAAKAVEVIEPIIASESKDIAETASEPIASKELEASPVVTEPVTSKKKKASSKSTAAKKSSIAPEAAEPKKSKEKAKSSGSKKQKSLAADRLFLGKQLPPGK